MYTIISSISISSHGSADPTMLAIAYGARVSVYYKIYLFVQATLLTWHGRPIRGWVFLKAIEQEQDGPIHLVLTV